MKQRVKQQGKITFGNLLLGLLVIGTFIVIALMGKLYIELTKTPEKTAQMHEKQEKNRVEIMSPNVKTDSKIIYQDSNSQSVIPVKTSSVTTSVDEQNTSVNYDQFAKENTANGEKKVNKKIAKPNDQVFVENNMKSEVPLKPINTPINNNDNKEMVENNKERPLKPKNVGKQKNSAIDELF